MQQISVVVENNIRRYYDNHHSDKLRKFVRGSNSRYQTPSPGILRIQWISNSDGSLNSWLNHTILTSELMPPTCRDLAQPYNSHQ